MNSTTRTLMQDRRQFLKAGAGLTLGGLLSFASSRAVAEIGATAAPIVRIEEDWELMIGTPDSTKNTPEIITSMGPVSDDSEPVICLLLNHRTQPSYEAGGMQLQVWRGGRLMAYVSASNTNQLNVANETIRFTLVMECVDAKLKYTVKNGASTSFGAFNGLTLSVPTGLTELKSYSWTDSIRRSVTNVGTLRLAKYQLNQVRAYDSVSGATPTTTTTTTTPTTTETGTPTSPTDGAILLTTTKKSLI